MKRTIILALAAILMIAASFCVGYHRGERQVVYRTDTLTVVKYDTAVVRKPVYLERRIVDTAYIAVDVERIVRDTVTNILCIELEREQRRYQDSTYAAWVSGIEPRLDSIHIYNRTYHQFLTKYEQRRCAIGISAGYGVMMSDGLRAGPYIGIGIQYNIFQF